MFFKSRKMMFLRFALIFVLMGGLIGARPNQPAKAAGGWEIVGASGFSAGVAHSPSLALDNDTPYVLYSDGDNGWKANVMKFDALLGNWVNIGATGFSAGPTNFASLALDNGTPYVAYVDSDYKLSVMKFDALLGNWVNVGAAGFSAGWADFTSLVLNNGTPYVTYSSYDDYYVSQTSVMKFDALLGSWVNIGAAVNLSSSGGISFAVDSGTPYLAYTDGRDGAKASLMKYIASDITAPIIDSFAVTSHSSNFDIPITVFSASDDVAVTGYLITQSSIAPSANDAGWSETIPTMYTVSAQGNYTLYPWVKDAAGNVSAVFGSPASVVVDIPVCYVDDSASGTNNGVSWANAYRDLQSALGNTSCSEIWVAAGTYTPTTGTDRTISFVLKDGVSIYGGFSGNETSLVQRDPAVNLTVLSGDLNGDDNSNIETDEPTRAENSLHVVLSDGVGSSTILDGVTITGGNANAAYGTDNSSGGGVWDGNGSPTLINLMITGNSARTMGGGMVATNSSSTLTAVTFENNYSSSDGGGLVNYLGDPTLTNIVFTDNTAGYSGGGLLNAHVLNTTFTNITFYGNTAFDYGGGMANYSSQFTLSKSTFFENQAVHPSGPTPGEGGGIYNYNSSPVIENTTFYGNTGSAIVNFSSSPLLTNVTFTKNGEALFNENSSHPVIRNSILWGNINPETGGPGTIVDQDNSSSTVSDSVIQNGFPSGTNIVTLDPMLGGLGRYGGNTQTVPLLSGSSAIDMGDDVNCPSTDQRGVSRPQGSHCDIGAYEFEGDATAPMVTSIVRANASPTNAASVNFTVTFSEPVNGVAVNDFILHPTGSVTGASVQGVSGSVAVYTVMVSTGTGNGTLRLDVPASATITDTTGNRIAALPFTSGESYSISKAATFSDVETDYWAWQYVERLVNAGITAGCGGGQYCPESSVTRAQMAIFLLRGIHGSSYAPPAVGGSTDFGDVQPNHWAGKWIKQLAVEKITGGCGNGNYCPDSAVTRAQMAIFLLKAKHGASYSPPAVGGSTGFGDVQPTHWAAAWIKQLVTEGITAGCGNGNYCPEQAVTRAQMAVFLVRTFNLP